MLNTFEKMFNFFLISPKLSCQAKHLAISVNCLTRITICIFETRRTNLENTSKKIETSNFVSSVVYPFKLKKNENNIAGLAEFLKYSTFPTSISKKYYLW